MRLSCVVSGFIVIGMLDMPTIARAQTPADGLQQEIQQLRKDLDALKQDYETRLAALEAKLTAAQSAAATAPPPQATVTTPERRGASCVRRSGLRIEDFQPRHRRHRQLPRDSVDTTPSRRRRRWRYPSPRCRSRPSSIPTRARTSSCRLAKLASTSRKGMRRSRPFPAGCLRAWVRCARRSARSTCFTAMSRRGPTGLS